MKIYTFLADGFETVEALAVIDVLRRAGDEVVTVSIKDTREVISAQKVAVLADTVFTECDFTQGDALFLPGGMPGTTNLKAHKGLEALIRKFQNADKYLVAICAGPTVLGQYGILDGKRATCYPGCEGGLGEAIYTRAGVEADGRIITARGMGKAVDLGLKLVEIFHGKEAADEMSKSIQYAD